MKLTKISYIGALFKEKEYGLYTQDFAKVADFPGADLSHAYLVKADFGYAQCPANSKNSPLDTVQAQNLPLDTAHSKNSPLGTVHHKTRGEFFEFAVSRGKF
jgi:uncharacterized protein YjbI with pentapeptide repeats